MQLITQIIIAVIITFMAGLFIWYLTEYVIKPRFQEKTTWKKLEQGLKKIIRDINNSDFTPDVVLGMKRSGTALAAMIAGSLSSLPITTIDFEQSKEGDLGERKIRITIEPNHQVLKDKNVLIVTCFNKTGEPLKAVMDHLPIFRTSLLNKATTLLSSLLK